MINVGSIPGILGALDVGGRAIAIVRNVGGSYEIVEAIYVDYDSAVVRKNLARASSLGAAKAALRLLGGAHAAQM